MATHPLAHTKTTLDVDGHSYSYYSLAALADPRVASLPYAIRVLLESAVRNCDDFSVTRQDVESILNWRTSSTASVEIPFKPARVLMQDFTGVPAIVDLAAMRDACARLGGNAGNVNPLVPVDLVVDHSVQVDFQGTTESAAQNLDREFERNQERFRFLKWGQGAFENLTIVPPGSGIVHQVNLEYLARVVFDTNGTLYPDSVVGTDSHTTMINGLGVLGWGVGGIEAEAVMLGQPTSMVLPEVVGFELVGELPSVATATDLVLTVTQELRKVGVVGKFVEFFGPGVASLSVADRATISNMAPEYGATCGFFPVDEMTIQYLNQSGRDAHRVQVIEQFSRAQQLFRSTLTTPTTDSTTTEIAYTRVVRLDLSTVVPCVSGPKRPHDRVPVSAMKDDFTRALTAPLGFKGFAIPEADLHRTTEFEYRGTTHRITHGAVVIAAITSCTNTSNPSVMLGAGLVAQKAVARGLRVPEYIKTSLAPGSGVVSAYLNASGLQPFLDTLGFQVVGYGCTTCIGNSGELPPVVHETLEKVNVVGAAVLSGNRNFEARVHPLTRANYLASPPLVVAYALAGTVNIDFETEPIGTGSDGQAVFLRDIWPTRAEVEECVHKNVLGSMFKQVYADIKFGNPRWNALEVPSTQLYPWEDRSTYIHNPPFFQQMHLEPTPLRNIAAARCLLNLGDSITTDHISPAGNIARTSSAAKYLGARGVDAKDFNSYGARRGNDEVMVRGTFANVRLVNKIVGQPGPLSVYLPAGEVASIYDVSRRYIDENRDIIVLAGAEYGSGSSRDWAAKGPFLLGIKAVVAVSYERIHRSNLIGMGILPLQFKPGQSADSLGLTGKEQFSIALADTELVPRGEITVTADSGVSFPAIIRVDTAVEVSYMKHGGILNFVLRQLSQKH